LTEFYHLLGMKSFRDDLIDRTKTGWGRFVLASKLTFFNTNKVSAAERKGIIEKNSGTDTTNFVHKLLRFRLYFNSVKLVICFPNGGTAAGLKHALKGQCHEIFDSWFFS
jgi:hypothetical protein